MAGRRPNALDQISRRYFEPVDDAKLFQAAVNGMVNHLEKEHKDDYSEYISPDQEREFDQSINRCLEGIGIRLDPKTKELTVFSPLVGSPAYEAGIRAGDRILKIDGRSTQGMSLKDALDAMHGDAGKAVALVILHEGEKQPIELQVVRRLVQDETVLGDVATPTTPGTSFSPAMTTSVTSALPALPKTRSGRRLKTSERPWTGSPPASVRADPRSARQPRRAVDDGHGSVRLVSPAPTHA